MCRCRMCVYPGVWPFNEMGRMSKLCADFRTVMGARCSYHDTQQFLVLCALKNKPSTAPTSLPSEKLIYSSYLAYKADLKWDRCDRRVCTRMKTKVWKTVVRMNCNELRKRRGAELGATAVQMLSFSFGRDQDGKNQG